MEKLYLDYNATSPLARSVSDWLAKGDFFWANPSSIHQSGKKAKFQIEDTKDFILRSFGLEKTHRLFFHSGATEGINSLLKGWAWEQKRKDQKARVALSSIDHSCVYNQSEDWGCYQANSLILPVNSQGDLIEEEWESCLKQEAGPTLLNYTWVHNETGAVWDLETALDLKKKTGALIHVDAAQAIGKIPNFLNLLPELDCYTFSGHKFGALKGIGFSLIAKDFEFHPFMRGGGQQEGLRSGTENTFGIFSLQHALEEKIKSFKPVEAQAGIDFFRGEITSCLRSQDHIVAQGAKEKNLNTVAVIIEGYRADNLLTAFDIGGIELSSGSACSSGSVQPSRVLMNMGYNEDQARSNLRFSFGTDLTLDYAQKAWEKVRPILERFVT